MLATKVNVDFKSLMFEELTASSARLEEGNSLLLA